MRHSSTSFSVLLGSLLLMLGFASCQSELDFPPHGEGSLVVTLENVSSAIVTRSTPSEIGKPLAEQFSLKAMNEADIAVYDGKFSTTAITLPIGDYHIEASYGANPVIATDAPYYVGSADVTIETDKASHATLVCKVGNSLVSAVFGSDDAERARFDKFYSTYGLEVKVSDQTATISNAAPSQSVYFRAGSSVSLSFVGTLKSDGSEVRMALDPSVAGFPASLAAADHAIVMLGLTDPESAAAVEISKVEVSEVTMEETIPLSWLPMPQVNAQHQYDESGNLVGTNLNFTNSYPGMTWKAEVKGDDQVVYRTVSGSGALASDYASNAAEWPYLPAGHYTATYYLLQDGKEPMKTGSRDFTVAAPELHINVEGGYTSYSKYVEGDVAAANACDASTVYAPRYTFNVSPSLLQNAKYSHTVSATFDGVQKSISQIANSANLPVQTGVAARGEAYKWQVKVLFDGQTISADRLFYITGLPANYAPPTESAGWKFTSGGNCSFESTYMKLATTVAPTPKAQSPSYFAPQDVNVSVTTSCSQNTGIFNYRYTLTFVGSDTKAENTTSRGNAKTFVNAGTLKAGEDHLITEYSYIAAGNYLQIFSLKVEYR